MSASWTIVPLLVLVACGFSPKSNEFSSLRIMRAQSQERALEYRVADGDPAVREIARLLERCTRREPAVFVAKYWIVARRQHGSDATFLVGGAYVKVDGVSYVCSRDLQVLVDDLWVRTPERPEP